MTLEQVMALDGRELLGKIAPLLDYKVLSPRECLNGHWNDGTTYCYESNGKWFRWTATDEHSDGWTEWNLDWASAMQIRDWARGLPNNGAYSWAVHLDDCIARRLDRDPMIADALLEAIPVDYCRAALLVEG